LRFWKPGEKCREAVSKLSQLPGAQAAHRPLQRPDSAPGSSAQNLLAIRSGMNLDASLIASMPASLDPAARDKSFQYVAYRGPLHSQACSQARGGNSRLFSDARKGAMHRNGRIGHALELAIQRAHAIDQRARR
jgi:hypothetical protein